MNAKRSKTLMDAGADLRVSCSGLMAAIARELGLDRLSPKALVTMAIISWIAAMLCLAAGTVFAQSQDEVDQMCQAIQEASR